MGQGTWKKRKPGSISGTIVPPPAGAAQAVLPKDLPPLPRRRPAARDPAFDRDPHGDPPVQLPDRVRASLKPVLMPHKARADGEPSTTRAGPVATPAHRPAAAAAPAAPVAPAATAATAATVPTPAAAAPTAKGQPRTQGRRRQAVLLVVLTVLSTGLAVALVRYLAPGAARGQGNGPAPAALAQAAAVRGRAASWIAQEISRGAFVACDKVMLKDLLKAGWPSSDVLTISPASPDPLGADVIAATPALRSLFGRRLATVYAPTVLASFGHGSDEVQVRVLAADGAAAYETALNSDQAARRLAGTQLLRNSRVAMPAAARGQIAAGQVDPRVLVTLAALAAQRPIRVLGFYDRPPGAGPGVPLSGVELSGAGRYQRWLVSFLRGQNVPYRAATITPTVSNGRSAVSVRFSRPSPLGLLHLLGVD